MSDVKCKYCRTVISFIENIQTHSKGQGQDAFTYRKRSSSNVPTNCQNYFFNSLPTNTNNSLINAPLEITETKGKINCPSCKQKLGHYDLAGAQCNCGTWIAPAFAISKSKVDCIL